VSKYSVNPSRTIGEKWSTSYKMYPEPKFPLYALGGAGFVLSRTFVQTAMDKGHIANFRSMSFEDVAIGMLAERTGFYPPVFFEGFNNYRSTIKVKHEIRCVKNGVSLSDCFQNDKSWPPKLDFRKILVQHRMEIKDMFDSHKSFTTLKGNICAFS